MINEETSKSPFSEEKKIRKKIPIWNKTRKGKI